MPTSKSDIFPSSHLDHHPILIPSINKTGEKEAGWGISKHNIPKKREMEEGGRINIYKGPATN
jgi:hypothetical protein